MRKALTIGLAVILAVSMLSGCIGDEQETPVTVKSVKSSESQSEGGTVASQTPPEGTPQNPPEGTPQTPEGSPQNPPQSPPEGSPPEGTPQNPPQSPPGSGPPGGSSQNPPPSMNLEEPTPEEEEEAITIALVYPHFLEVNRHCGRREPCMLRVMLEHGPVLPLYDATG